MLPAALITGIAPDVLRIGHVLTEMRSVQEPSIDASSISNEGIAMNAEPRTAPPPDIVPGWWTSSSSSTRRTSTSILREVRWPQLPELLLSARDFAVVRHLFRRGPARAGAFCEADIDGYVEPLSHLTAALNYHRTNVGTGSDLARSARIPRRRW